MKRRVRVYKNGGEKNKKDKWGRSPDSKWYGFNPDTKEWTLGKPERKVVGRSKPVGYYRNNPPQQQPSDRLGNGNPFLSIPSGDEVQQQKEQIKEVGKTAEAIRKRTPGLSHEESIKRAQLITQVRSKPQPSMRQINLTEADKARSAYIFDEGTHVREYLRMPLQFLAGDMPTEEERIQERIRYTDPNTSASDKFIGTLGQAAELAPSATLNTAAGLAFAPANYGKFAKVLDAVSPIGTPGLDNLGRYVTQNTPLRNAWKINPNANKSGYSNLPVEGELIRHPFRDETVPIENISNRIDYFHLEADPGNMPYSAAQGSEAWEQLNKDKRFFIKRTDTKPHAVIDMPINYSDSEGGLIDLQKMPIPLSKLSKYRSQENMTPKPHWWRGYKHGGKKKVRIYR